MSVEKMYFVNISGPKAELDSFVLNCVIPHEVQLVKVFTIMDAIKGLLPYSEDDPYEPILRKLDSIGIKPSKGVVTEELFHKKVDLKSVEKKVSQIEVEVGDIRDKRVMLQETLKRKETTLRQILPMQNLDIEIDELFHFKHMKFRFGKMPTDAFEKLQEYVEKVEIVVQEVYVEDDEVYLVYFTPQIHKETIDSLLSSLFFTRIRISDEVKGYPRDAIEQLEGEIKALAEEIAECDTTLDAYLSEQKDELENLYLLLESLNQVFKARNYSAHSQEAFFLTGWIPATNLADFESQMSEMHGFTHLTEEDDAVKKVKPPTKLKNNKFFKPFESLVSMYGTPSYNEVDPTVFVAITYMLMFGLMFGDFGQGLVIALGGAFLYKKKGINIGILGVYIGLVSMVTGLIYGSVFGNEHFLRHLFPGVPFLNAMDSENMLLVLGGTIGLGVAIMIIAMAINILNAYRTRNLGRLLFDRNGVVGMVFYLSILGLVGLVVVGKVSVIGVVVPAVLIGISLIVILLSHPLQNYVNKKRKVFPDDKVGYFIESTFEVIEVVLAVLSNTISFMRIGAFAMNHVGFSLAFEILSDMVSQNGNTLGGILVMIIGNIVIIVLEGMIVGIQCMRLEYYELFSRFFGGDGVKFEPFTLRNRA